MDPRIEAILRRELATLEVQAAKLATHIETLDKNRRMAVEQVRAATANLAQMTTDIAALKAVLGT